MSLQQLSGKIKRKPRKRVGRGNGSGHGTFSCKGMKGQTARSGGRRRPGFEGGQTPYISRLPKLKGFKNPGRINYQPINVGDLNVFDDKAEINAEVLYTKNLISRKNRPIKLLAGKGELTKTLTITADKASKKAIEAVESKKGKVVLPVIKEVKVKENA